MSQTEFTSSDDGNFSQGTQTGIPAASAMEGSRMMGPSAMGGSGTGSSGMGGSGTGASSMGKSKTGASSTGASSMGAASNGGSKKGASGMEGSRPGAPSMGGSKTGASRTGASQPPTNGAAQSQSKAVGRPTGGNKRKNSQGSTSDGGEKGPSKADASTDCDCDLSETCGGCADGNSPCGGPMHCHHHHHCNDRFNYFFHHHHGCNGKRNGLCNIGFHHCYGRKC